MIPKPTILPTRTLSRSRTAAKEPRGRTLFVVLAAAAAALSAAAPIATVPITHLFDIRGDGAVAFALPTDVAVGRDGRIYVVDGGHHRVVAFDQRGRHLFNIGGPGAGDGKFQDPVGVGVDGKGRVYVADTGNHRIQVFDGDGAFEYAIDLVDQGKPVRPIDVAADDNGNVLYVTGNNNHAVMVLQGRQVVNTWGGEGPSNGEFRYPASVIVAPNGFIYVVDVLNTRVQVFDKSGKYIVNTGDWGVLPGQLFRPKGVAVDQRGQIYVSDSYLDVIQVYDRGHRFAHVLGQAGEPYKLIAPGGIAIDEQDRLYVAEVLENKVSVFRLSN